MWIKDLVSSFSRWHSMGDQEHRNSNDVIRRLNEVEENLADGLKELADYFERRIDRVEDALKKDTADILAAIAGIVPPPEAVSAKLTLLIGGIPMGAPVTIQNTLSGGTSTFVESTAAGVVVPAIGPLTYASDN